MERVRGCKDERSRLEPGRVKRTRALWFGALMIGVAFSLARFQPSWAQPHQNQLRDTINTPVPSPTRGPTSTGTPIVAPGVTRVILREGSPRLQVADDYEGTTDTYIDAYTARVPQTLDGGLRLKGGEIRSVLARFDLAGEIPAGADIVEAELLFYVEIPAFTPARALDVAAFRILKEWDEAQASWNYVHAANRTPWGSPGCNGVEEDRIGDPEDTITLFHRAVYRGLDVTQSVRYWLQHPDENFGWLIKGVSPSTADFSLASSRNSVLAHRPSLRIDYTTTEITPTATLTSSSS